jgi:hypothetical protein
LGVYAYRDKKVVSVFVRFFRAPLQQQCRNKEPENFAFELMNYSYCEILIRTATRRTGFDITGWKTLKSVLTEVLERQFLQVCDKLITQIRLAYKKNSKKNRPRKK